MDVLANQHTEERSDDATEHLKAKVPFFSLERQIQLNASLIFHLYL